MLVVYLSKTISINDFSYGKQSLKSTASRFLGMPFLKNELKNNFTILLISYISPVTERTGKGLQILLRRFESDRGVNKR